MTKVVYEYRSGNFTFEITNADDSVNAICTNLSFISTNENSFTTLTFIDFNAAELEELAVAFQQAAVELRKNVAQ